MFWSWFSFGVAVRRENSLSLNYFKAYLAFPFSNRCLPTTVMVACQERIIAIYYYKIKIHLQGTITVAQRDERILKRQWDGICFRLYAASLFPSLSHFWHYTSIHIRLFPAVCEVEEWETGACAAPPQTLKNQKWLVSWLATSNACVELWMGSLLPTHVLSQGNRQWVVQHGRASCHVQASQTSWKKAQVFHCWRESVHWWLW